MRSEWVDSFMSTIERTIAEACHANRGRPAVDDGETTLTFGELDARVDTLATELFRGGLEIGEPVAVLVSNRADDVAGFLAVWRAGGVAVPVHRNTPTVVADKLKGRLGARFQMNHGVEHISDVTPATRPLLASAGTVVFTSGTTGDPKGVVQSPTRAADKLDMIAETTAWGAGGTTLIGLQLTFSFGQWATWLTLARGGLAVLRGRFQIDEIRALLEAGEITRFPVVPTMLRQFAMTEADTNLAGRNWDGTFMAGGEALPAPVGRKTLASFPRAGLGDIYGLSETGTSDFFVQPGEYDLLAGTIGHAGLGIDHRIGEDGELLIRSPWGMLGYLDAPGDTEKAFLDGYFRTGDLVRARADGALELVGRAKDLVIRGGNKIAPLEIESLFLENEDVVGALAAGVSDEARGEALHLAVVARAGRALEPARLMAWAAERLERYKLPDEIHVLQELPAGGTGKADRSALAQMIKGR